MYIEIQLEQSKMDKLSSIRVSGGFSCSLLTRGLSIRIDSLKLEFILSATKLQQDLERDLTAFYAAVEWPKSSSDALHVHCRDSNRYIHACAYHTTYYYMYIMSAATVSQRIYLLYNYMYTLYTYINLVVHVYYT